MRSLPSPNPAHISATPGLYISDILIPASAPNLADHGITHVLTILNNPLRPPIPAELGILHEYIEIDDDPLANLLEHLEKACTFISNALTSRPHPPSTTEERENLNDQPDTQSQQENDNKPPKVLIHCLQGVSRSGSLIIAYLMRTLSLTYPAALDLARSYRDAITPNEGFAAQLELWGSMGCSVVDSEGREKEGYRVWKRGREEKLRVLGEEGRRRERVRGMVGMAAEFGARRAVLRKMREDNEEGGEGAV